MAPRSSMPTARKQRPKSSRNESSFPDFFISFTKSDQQWADWICGQLSRLNRTYIYQAENFSAGTDFMQEMRSGAKRCRHMIAVLSPAYFDSEFAQMELNNALARDPLGVERALLPIRVMQVDLPDFMKTRIYIDLVDKDPESARRELCQKVEGFLLTHPVRARKRIPFPGSYKEKMHISKSDTIQEDSHRRGGVHVLFVGSRGGIGLDLASQFNQMKKVLRRGKNRFRLFRNLAVTAETLLDELNDSNPEIFHFSGKQDGGDIIISSRKGGVVTMSDLALAGLLTSLDTPPRLAIIDTCYSSRCAERLTETLDFAVGVKSWIYEHEAVQFYNTLYAALAAGRSVKEAVAQATFRGSNAGIPRSRMPQLFHRCGVSAAKAFLGK